MEESPSQAGGKKRGRPAGKPLTARELEARRANLRRARQAPRELIYRPTTRRWQAACRNLLQAWKARRRPEVGERLALNALRHGLYARKHTGASVTRLSESAQEFREHRELMRRLLVPRDNTEELIVEELADLAWRRLRLFRAHAAREARELRRKTKILLADGCPVDAMETATRIVLLVQVLDDARSVLSDADKILDELRRMADLLIEQRGGVGLWREDLDSGPGTELGVGFQGPGKNGEL